MYFLLLSISLKVTFTHASKYLINSRIESIDSIKISLHLIKVLIQKIKHDFFNF